MQELTDTELLRRYADQNAEDAFATLVSRHMNLVYSAALRKTGNAHAAEEITHAVFIILAKKARALCKETILSGWLYQTTRLTAMNFLRGEIRRVHREQEAYVQSLSNETEPDIWPRISPLLEDAMGNLSGKERDAIALRFFQGKSFQEIATVVGASENAAKKRVAHALEKLRDFFAKRGVASTTSILAGVISANSIQAAPVALGKSVAAIALTKGAAASGSTLALIKGALKLMAWTKMKTTVVVGAAVLIAAGTITVKKIHYRSHAGQGDPANTRRLFVSQIDNGQLRIVPAQNQQTEQRSTCPNNLRQIDSAKQQWAMEKNKTANAVPTEQDLTPYLRTHQLPTCPDGGAYSLNAVGQPPTCSIPGHVFSNP